MLALVVACCMSSRLKNSGTGTVLVIIRAYNYCAFLPLLLFTTQILFSLKAVQCKCVLVTTVTVSHYRVVSGCMQLSSLIKTLSIITIVAVHAALS